MKLNLRTIQTLKDLENVDWFSQVGMTDLEHAVIVKSWDEALYNCLSEEWGKLQMEAANRYRERLIKISKERFKSWNDIVGEVKKITEPLVTVKLHKVVTENALPKEFVNDVKWDILHLAMEAEFADIYPPGFYASQAFYYLRGHFPCGWSGVFPDGQQIVY